MRVKKKLRLLRAKKNLPVSQKNKNQENKKAHRFTDGLLAIKLQTTMEGKNTHFLFSTRNIFQKVLY